MEGTAKLLYDKAPKWFKVIKWREWGQRISKRQKMYVYVLYVPAVIGLFYTHENTTAIRLYLKRPQTPEELMTIKQNTMDNVYRTHFEPGQYRYDVAPLYDLSIRRKAYPEHYGNKYDGFKKDYFN